MLLGHNMKTKSDLPPYQPTRKKIKQEETPSCCLVEIEKTIEEEKEQILSSDSTLSTTNQE